ncbi:MAG: alkyl sulfatase dimerization domain-containing protein, partial [Candidatus Acidiferrales bacterium]
AKAALDLYYQHRPKKPVIAVIYTHSHVDHYGGVKGIVSEADVNSGKVHIYAPEGFLEETVSENVFAGNAMSRRALYMYGALLPRGPYGQVDGGLGKTNSIGTVTLIPPTDIISKTGETKTIDGVQIVFQMAQGTEAPAEMMFYFPQFKAFCASEVATHTFHNLITLRGAQVRSATNWWKALNTSLDMFGDKTEVEFASHHWPTWGNAQVIDFLEKQRDLYKYVNDQCLRLMNQGYTMTEIAEQMKLPKSLEQEWYNRDYYGSLNHNSKGVYQRYLGWYDSNPANLYPWPPEDLAKRYVEAIGGEDAIVQKAKSAFDQGDYRWAAELGKHAVFANPESKAARDVEADALEQLGYQTEDPTWRNEFLMGAFELRNGIPKIAGAQSASPDTIRAMTVEMILDFMGMRIDGPRAEGKVITMNWILPDTNQRFAVTLKNSALTYTADKQLSGADFTLTMPRSSMDNILLQSSTIAKELASGTAKISGDQQKFNDLINLMVNFDPLFNIVTP